MICKVGDIFRTTNDKDGDYTLAYDAIDYYCKLINIVDKEGNYYDELDIITGHGDRNTKVLLHLKVLCNKNLEECEQVIVKRDPHKVYKVDIKWELNKINLEREFLNKKEEFLKRNMSLDTKLKKLGI